MTASVKIGGAWKAVSAVFVKVSGAWKAVPALSARVGGAWRQVIVASGGALTCTLLTSGTVNGGTVANGAQTYGESQVSVSGGTPPYGGSWVRQSGDTAIQPTNPSDLYTEWTSTGTDQSFASVYRFEATDDAAGSANSDPVSISATHGTPP